MNEVTISVRAMVDELNKSGIYDEDMFIDNEQAIDITDENTRFDRCRCKSCELYRM